MNERQNREILEDPGYSGLKSFIIDTTGLAYYYNRDQTLAGKVALRLRELRVPNCSEYLGLLKSAGGGELDTLISHLTIGETYFFRNRPHFEALEHRIIPDLLSRNASTKCLDIWSAGCATGPEPYSLSLLLRHRMALRLAGWNVQILASDINQQFLEQAREARYSQWAFRSIPEDLLRACFHREQTRWRLNSKFQTDVDFIKHNLVGDAFPPLSTRPLFDLIVCRNVLIYFKVDIIRRLVNKFHACLKPGGWLLVGHAEPSIDLFASFETVRSCDTILYRKSSEEAADSPFQPVVAPETFSARPVSAPAAPTLKQSRVVTTRIESESEKLRRLTDLGRWEEALTLCESAISREPLRADLHFFMALIQHNLGDVEARDLSLKRTLYLDRAFIQAHYYKGVFECERGGFQEAGRSFRSVLRLLEDRQRSKASSHTELDVLAPEQLRRMSLYYLRRMGEPSE